MKMHSLAGNFLIASPGLDDPHFSQSVVLMCDHTDNGAFGIVVNRVLTESFQSLAFRFDLKKGPVDMPVYYGGPVQPEQGYIIYAPFRKKYGLLKITKNIGVSSSRELLQDILNGKGPDSYLFSLGHSGWGANQIEEELMTDSWLVVPMAEDIIFSVKPAERWRSAARLIGVDFHRYSKRSGNA
ncbi:MAG: YqgE/AlgH family protein [Nitrospirae bacterium]|nr:YqgE/AlgH family protein [Nitrospirota bacterium]